MRRGLGSLLAVWVLVALFGLTVESTAALASGRDAHARRQSADIKGSSHAHRARSSQARDRGIGALYPGESGSPVRVLQRELARAGDSPGPIDGRYGPLTERAVERLQAARGLAIDGIAGPRTWAALSVRGGELFPTAGYYSPGGSEAVRVLQRRLARAGDPPGPIDGRYGPRTEHAVRRFQAGHGLRVDGIARPRTLIDLEAPRAVRRPKLASTHPRSRRHRAWPRVATRPRLIGRAPRTAIPKSAPQTHGSSSPAKWLVLLGILALGVVLRVRHVSRPAEVGILPSDTIVGQPKPEFEPGPPTGLPAPAADDRTHPETGWQRDKTQRTRAAVLERERRRHAHRGRRKR